MDFVFVTILFIKFHRKLQNDLTTNMNQTRLNIKKRHITLGWVSLFTKKS